MKEINLSYLIELERLGLDNRMRVHMEHQRLTHKWIPPHLIRENGWPKALEVIKRLAKENNIKVIEPDAYFTFEVLSPLD